MGASLLALAKSIYFTSYFKDIRSSHGFITSATHNNVLTPLCKRNSGLGMFTQALAIYGTN